VSPPQALHFVAKVVRRSSSSYACSGHSGNKELKNSQPGDLRFSILQRTSPDLDPETVIALEASWKTRLHTRELGLNRN
jgi:hypothetical protein